MSASIQPAGAPAVTGANGHRSRVQLTCPSCAAGLREHPRELSCSNCGQTFPVRDGIPVFCEGEDFYEEYAEEHIPYVIDPPAWKRALLKVLPYHSWREWKFFNAHLKPGGLVVDIGSGRGKGWFSSRGDYVVGIDPCWTALRECARHYDLAVQAGIASLPLPDSSFDYAVSSHVLGHIGPDEKDAAVAEIARVLKPGGRSINIIETDSDHPLVRFAKEDPELYRVNFIETDGHIGLEPASSVIERFRRHGLEAVAVRKMESGRIWLRYYEKYLSQGFPDRDPRIARKIRRWQRIARNPVRLGVYEIAMGAYHHMIEQRSTPLDHSMFLMICAEKRAS